MHRPPLPVLLPVLVGLWPGGDLIASPECRMRFGLSFPDQRSAAPLDGRLLLLISANDENEPRFQINDGPQTQLAFGIDVDGLAPGEQAIIDGTVLGYPLVSLAEIPPGDYWV